MINSFNTKAVRLSSESKVCAFNQKRNKKLVTDNVEKTTTMQNLTVTSDLVKQSDDTNNYQCDSCVISKYTHTHTHIY